MVFNQKSYTYRFVFLKYCSACCVRNWLKVEDGKSGNEETNEELLP